MQNRICVCLLFAVLLFALFVWPTLYRYDHVGSYRQLIRINRVTGSAEILKTGEGWIAIKELKLQ